MERESAKVRSKLATEEEENLRANSDVTKCDPVERSRTTERGLPPKPRLVGICMKRRKEKSEHDHGWFDNHRACVYGCHFINNTSFKVVRTLRCIWGLSPPIVSCCGAVAMPATMYVNRTTTAEGYCLLYKVGLFRHFTGGSCAGAGGGTPDHIPISETGNILGDNMVRASNWRTQGSAEHGRTGELFRL